MRPLVRREERVGKEGGKPRRNVASHIERLEEEGEGEVVEHNS